VVLADRQAEVGIMEHSAMHAVV